MAPPEGSKGVKGELETRDGSDSPVIVEKGEVPPANTVEGSEADELNDDGASSVSSTRTNMLHVDSDDGGDFDPDLPTDYKPQVQANLEKELVIEETKPEVDEGKSEKIVPVSTVKTGTESAETSQPAAKPEAPIIDAKTVKPFPSVSLKDDLETQEVFLFSDAICMKQEFRMKGHKKSGKYYLPTSPNLSKVERIQGF